MRSNPSKPQKCFLFNYEVFDLLFPFSLFFLYNKWNFNQLTFYGTSCARAANLSKKISSIVSSCIRRLHGPPAVFKQKNPSPIRRQLCPKKDRYLLGPHSQESAGLRRTTFWSKILRWTFVHASLTSPLVDNSPGHTTKRFCLELESALVPQIEMQPSFRRQKSPASLIFLFQFTHPEFIAIVMARCLFK